MNLQFLGATRRGRLALLATLSVATLGVQSTCGPYEAQLSGDAELPPVDSAATGEATFRYSALRGDGKSVAPHIAYQLDVEGADTIVAAHIHCGGEEANGPVVARLFDGASPGDGFRAKGKIYGADVVPQEDSEPCPGGVADLGELLAKMGAGGTYVNVHTEAFPAGEVRGQIAVQELTPDCPEPDYPPGIELGNAKLRFTPDCVPFVRTPDSQFKELADWDYKPRYATVDGLRFHYVDVGPANGEVVLMLHGQPSWSYLYRKMIPVVAEAGFRVIAVDMIGMGRSDKPVELGIYRYLQHVAWVSALLDEIPTVRGKKPRGLEDITLFCQDWGSLIGLRVVGDLPDRFARVVVANGRLPVVPGPMEIIQVPDPPLLDPDAPNPFTTPCSLPGSGCFERWAVYALTNPAFQPSEVLETATVVELSPEEEAAYDAPFPEPIYRAGPRVFPSLINTIGERPTNVGAWLVFLEWQKPLLTLAGRLDRGLGSEAVQSILRDNVPGAAGQAHHAYPDAAHFIQEDKGEDLARRVVEFMQANPLPN